MSSELIKHTGGLVTLIDDTDLSEMIKPLKTEIHLFDTYIAGTTYIEDKSVFDKINVGDRVKLRREDNKFDDKAILVLFDDNSKLGYVPEKDNLVFSRLMDAGKLLEGKIKSINTKGSFKKIQIGILMVDY